MPEIFFIFVVSLLVTTFVRPSWLNWAVFMAGLLVVFSAAAISIAGNNWHDLTPLYLWVGAWFWGTVISTLTKLIRMGAAQVTCKSPSYLPWLNWLMSAWWLVFAAGSVGYAFASNIAVSYAKSNEAAWILYDRSMAGAASGFFYLSLAANSALIAFIKPALTHKGLRTSGAAMLEWKDIESHDWQVNKLIIHKKTKFSQRWLRETWVVVDPPDLEIANHILAQHLPDQRLHPPDPVPVTT